MIELLEIKWKCIKCGVTNLSECVPMTTVLRCQHCGLGKHRKPSLKEEQMFNERMPKENRMLEELKGRVNQRWKSLLVQKTRKPRN